MTYRETLQWMYSRFAMYQQRGRSAYNSKLDNIREFSAYLGNPHRGFKSIHVGGTNGKGSSSHMLASVLQEAGYNVGLYTSPHLKDFRERIRIDGTPISAQYVMGFVRRHEKYLNNQRLSFFEMSVGMAFEYFQRKSVDIAIIEVGLGGRLDSTNIIIPEVCLITNIGLEHTEILGDTLAEIAKEKAGIIKEAVPVVVSETQAQTEEVFKKVAAKKNAPIFFADQMGFQGFPTSLAGNYQKRNVIGVMAVLAQLECCPHTEAHLRNGLMRVVEHTGLLGRWQILGKNPLIICDTAHNREGLEVVLSQLLEVPCDRLHIVLGFIREKSLDSILPLFPKHAVYYFTRPAIERGLEVKILAETAGRYGLSGTRFESVSLALKGAKKAAELRDLIFIGGSTFTVAEVL